MYYKHAIMKRIHNDWMSFPCNYNLHYESITIVFIRIPEPSATQRNPYIIVLHFPSMPVSVPGHKKHRNKKTVKGKILPAKVKGEIGENADQIGNYSVEKPNENPRVTNREKKKRKKTSACMTFVNP